MKKSIFIFVLVVVALLASTTMAWALEGYVGEVPKDSHKIKTKWNLQGSFVSERDPEVVGQTWTYNFQIKEAMYGEYSKGVIEFTSGDSVITAHVEATKTNYHYWTRTGAEPISTNLASVGWADYNGEIYNFMSIYAEGWIWIILSHDDYSDEWAEGLVYISAREHQLLAEGFRIADVSYDFDPHEIR